MADYKCYADAAKLVGLELPEPEEGSVRISYRTFSPGKGEFSQESGVAVDISYAAKGRSKDASQYLTFQSSRDPAGIKTDKIVVQNGFSGVSVGTAKSNGEFSAETKGSAPKITQPNNIAAALKQIGLCP